MIQVIVKNSKTGSQYICKIASVMVYQAARINQSMKLYKTVGAPFGAMKKLNQRLVLGTARKKTLKDIAKTINVRL